MLTGLETATRAAVEGRGALKRSGCTGSKENSQPQQAVHPQALSKEEGALPGNLKGGGKGCTQTHSAVPLLP